MAMGHPMPGLGTDKISQNQKYLRVVSAPPDIRRLRTMLLPMDSKAAENIRNNAKRDWSAHLDHNKRSVTTYSGLHAKKVLDQPTQYRVRPSSPTRLNKPHPQEVFLVTRLQKIGGCYEPQKAFQEKYGDEARGRLENYLTKKREISNKSHIKRAQSADYTSYNARRNIRTVMGDVPAQATEAWIKLSNDTDKKEILKSINRKMPSKNTLQYTQVRVRKYPSLRREIGSTGKTVEPVMSTTRWMKKAGQEESMTVRKLLEALQKAPMRVVPNEGPHFHITDYSSMFTSAPKGPHYDFQIHPEWHQPWHKQYVKPVST